jgi:hypothetical protein
MYVGIAWPPELAQSAISWHQCPLTDELISIKGGLPMQIFHEVMNWFYVGLMVGAIGIGVWFYNKKKESDR